MVGHLRWIFDILLNFQHILYNSCNMEKYRKLMLFDRKCWERFKENDIAALSVVAISVIKWTEIKQHIS